MKRYAATSQAKIIEHLRSTILPVARKHRVKNVRLFGSFARGEQRKSSDIDLLVSMPKNSSLIDIAALKIELERELAQKVDVVPDNSIRPDMKLFILADAHPL